MTTTITITILDASVLRYSLLCIRKASQAVFMMNTHHNNNDIDISSNNNIDEAAASLLTSSEILASWGLLVQLCSVCPEACYASLLDLLQHILLVHWACNELITRPCLAASNPGRTLWTNFLSHDMHLLCRFAGAVTAFAPGSHASMPPTGVSLPGVFMAGDWLAQGPSTHGAKGLSQEKAYVTGLQAGNQVAVTVFSFFSLRCIYPA